MMKTLRTVVLLGLVLATVTACQKAPEEGQASATSSTASAVPKEFIGTWQLEGLPVIYKMNSKGRVSFDAGPEQSCRGKYEAKDGTLSITYDPGQNGCFDAAVPYTLKDDGKTLDFMGTVYKKVDDKDDTSF